jgi:hypothetical protein
VNRAKALKALVGSKRLYRPDGVFHYIQKSPDGHEMWGKFVYREIVALVKFVPFLIKMEIRSVLHLAQPGRLKF